MLLAGTRMCSRLLWRICSQCTSCMGNGETKMLFATIAPHQREASGSTRAAISTSRIVQEFMLTYLWSRSEGQQTPRPRCRWTRYSITPTRCLRRCLSEHPRARFRRIRSLNWCVSQPGDISRSTCVAAGQRRPGQRSVLDKICTAKSLPP